MNWYNDLLDTKRSRLIALLADPRGADARAYADGDTAFGCWLLVTSALCHRAAGVSIFDLADMTWRDWFDDDLNPADALELALHGEGLAD